MPIDKKEDIIPNIDDIIVIPNIDDITVIDDIDDIGIDIVTLPLYIFPENDWDYEVPDMKYPTRNRKGTN